MNEATARVGSQSHKKKHLNKRLGGPQRQSWMAQEKIHPSSRNRNIILWSSNPLPSQHTDRQNLAHMSDTLCYITLELRLKRLVF